MKIVSGTSSASLSGQICKYLKTKPTQRDIKRFADSEVYVEIKENMRGNDVYLIQSTSYPANDNIM